jgi:hypothetical protein
MKEMALEIREIKQLVKEGRKWKLEKKIFLKETLLKKIKI